MSVTIKNINIDHYKLPVMVISLKDKSIISIPSQIGCAINCDFCLSKNNKFVRNLNFKELEILALEGINSESCMISFTGEGEPILNIDNINKSILLLEDNPRIKDFRICMSGIKADNLSLINSMKKSIDLQFSLHSPFDDIRKTLIQHTKPISFIKENILTNQSKFREIAINYVLMRGINDREEDLNELMSIIDSNWLIKLNPLLDETDKYKQSNNVNYFYDILTKNGFKVKKFNKIGSTIKNELYDQLTYENTKTASNK